MTCTVNVCIGEKPHNGTHAVLLLCAFVPSQANTSTFTEFCSTSWPWKPDSSFNVYHQPFKHLDHPGQRLFPTGPCPQKIDGLLNNIRVLQDSSPWCQIVRPQSLREMKWNRLHFRYENITSLARKIWTRSWPTGTLNHLNLFGQHPVLQTKLLRSTEDISRALQAWVLPTELGHRLHVIGGEPVLTRILIVLPPSYVVTRVFKYGIAK